MNRYYVSWHSIWFLYPYRYYNSLVGWNCTNHDCYAKLTYRPENIEAIFYFVAMLANVTRSYYLIMYLIVRLVDRINDGSIPREHVLLNDVEDFQGASMGRKFKFLYIFGILIFKRKVAISSKFIV